MKTQVTPIIRRVCILALIAAPSLALAEPGNLMQMNTTMKMEMPGTPAGAMPPQTHTSKVCTSARKPDVREMMKGNQDCAISNYRQSGDTISYHMTCSKELHMEGDAKMQMLAGGGIHGQMQMVSTSPGQKMNMAMSFDGTRVGSCDYQPH